MTNKLSYIPGHTYMHEGCTGKVRFLDSHIKATRVGLDFSCMTCDFKKFIDLCDQTTGNKKTWVYLKLTEL